MRTHDDHREALALHALGALAELERAEVEAHLADCPPCLRELAELRESAASLAVLAKPVEPSPGRFDEILRELGANAAASAPARARRSLRAFFARRPVVWTARFAVAMAMVVLVVSEWQLLGRLDQALVEVERMREIGAFVTSPGVSMVPLWGTDAAHGAHAKLAYEHASGRYMLFSSRMPVPPEGKRYQLWVITDRVRPAGAFSLDSPDGTLHALPRGGQPFVFGLSLEPKGLTEVAEPTTGMMLMSGPVPTLK
jgi:hypothetical protein